MIRNAAIAAIAALGVALTPAPASAQAGAGLPFEPLPSSAECTTSDPREVAVTAADDLDSIVSTRDRSGAGRDGALGARALGRSVTAPQRGALPLGLVSDTDGNRYAAAATNEGVALFRVSAGPAPRVHVLQVDPDGDGTGVAAWLPILALDISKLDRAALASDATTWSEIGDVAVDDETIYLSLPREHRVLAVLVDDGRDRYGRDRAGVWSFVEADENAPWAYAPPTSENSFTFPTQLAVRNDQLLIAESHDGAAGLKSRGDDVWVAAPGDPGEPSPAVGRLATLEHCDARVTGMNVGPTGTVYLRIARTGSFFGLVLKN